MKEQEVYSPEAEWHLKLFQRSFLQRAKLHHIEKMMPSSTHAMMCLDLGGGDTVISHYLPRKGGEWKCGDRSELLCNTLTALVGPDRVFKVEDAKLPFPDNSMDLIVIIGLLEHIDDDYGMIQECHRVLKQNGKIVANVPHAKKMSLVPSLRNLLGLTAEVQGNVRPGYSENQMYTLLKDGFDITDSLTYNKFFVQVADILVQFFGSFIRDKGKLEADPLTQEVDVNKYQKISRFYGLMYPFVWFASKLDLLLVFSRGHSLVVKAQARPWRPRVTPKLRDGRSIAEATMNSKIGTAAPF